MKNILLISSDALYMRMLELEFLQCGFGVISGVPSRDAFSERISGQSSASEDMTVCIIDCDCPSAQALANVLSDAGGDFISPVYYGCKEQADYPFLNSSDDYRRRPFRVSDFIIHVSRLLSSADVTVHNNLPYKPANDLKLNARNKSASYLGKPLSLTVTEYLTLSYLMDRRGCTVTREEINAAVRGEKKTSSSNVADVYVRFLRKKIDDVYGVKLIHTVRGVGYTIEP